ncbi:MAG: hypothetical protein HY913_06740 [Desulfomonile tiedjei]|nr:hypothetical protein [Desulfomonile tiedjei]
MQQKEPVDIITDIMALTSYGNTKNIMLMAVETGGPFDEAAFKLAVNKGASICRNYKSVLREIHEGRAFYLTRDYKQDLDIPIFSTPLRVSTDSPTTFDDVVSHLTPALDKQWDHWNVPPLEVHILNIGHNHRVLTFLAHHVAGDAAMVVKVVSEILGQYHNMTTGETPSWATPRYVLSTSRKKASSPRKAGWKGLWSQLKRDLAYRKRKPQKPQGNGRKGDPREWQVQRLVSTEDTDRILKGLSTSGLHVVDHLVACANISLDKWNAARQVAPGFASSVMTVNMRERFGGAEEKNYSSAIFFNSPPEQRSDYPEFVRSVAQARLRQLGRQADLSLRKSIARGAKFFSLFPLGIRRTVARTFMEFQRYSVAVGFLGVVWPEFKDEKMGPDSCLKKLGDANVFDVYGTGYKLAGNAYINLYAFIYCRQLHLVLSSAADLLTKEECDTFADIILESVFHAARQEHKDCEN